MHRRLLITDTLTPSLRLAAALGRGPRSQTVLATFARGRSQAAALVGRLGVPQRSLADWHAPTPEEALLGACQASGATELVMWACPRGVAALHALRHLDDRPVVSYLVPRTGTSPWGETEAIATRSGNLIHRFVVEDPATAARLEDIGVPESRIALPSYPVLAARALPNPSRVVLIAGLDEEVRRRARDWCESVGLAASHASITAAVGVALGLGGRPGHMIVSEGVVDAIAPLVQATAHGWGVTVVAEENAGAAWDSPLAAVASDELETHLEAIA